jgi:hypothetical protein
MPNGFDMIPWGPRARGATVALAALSVLILLAPGALALPAGNLTSPSTESTHHDLAPVTASGPATYHLPPGLRVGAAPFRAVSRPAQSDLFYLQSGSTISSINDSSATGTPRISEYIPLVNSPYSTAYELNGLTNTGDWWQIVVADNWPGCNTGFEEATEIWDNAQNSGPITCDSTVTLSAGDLVELTLYFGSGGNGCLGLKDVTTAVSHTLCDAQPNTGGTKWEFLSTAADSNGYYTGTMTEVVNSTATSCPDYKLMPTVEYEFSNGTYVTEYVPWSDEFDLFQSNGTRVLCYASSNGTATIGPGDPTSQYVDSAAGTSYGPRWADGENYSIVDPSYGFRYETDPTRLTAVSLSGGPSTPTAGTIVNFTTSVSGGVSPYSVIWRLNGVISGTANLTWSWRAGLAGPYKFDVFVVDAHGDAIGPSNVVNITVPGPLAIGGIVTTPTAGTDQGLAVSITADVSGGFGYWVFNWTGLPTGCPAENTSTISCFPNVTGSSNISVTVRDENGSMVAAGPHPFQVFASLAVHVTANASVLDVGQSVSFIAVISGGSGGETYIWSSFSGCVGRGAEILCTPGASGPEFVYVTVNDTVGATRLSPGIEVQVDGALAVSLEPNQVLADEGTTFSLRAAVSGGAYPLQYRWSGLPAGCSPTGPVANCSLPDSANYLVDVRVTDSAGEVVSASSIQVLGHPTPGVTVTASNATVAPESTVTFTATTTGGAPPFAYRWSGLPDGCSSPTTASVSCTPTLVGNYFVTVAATDQANQTVRDSTTVAVAGNATNIPPTPPGTTSGMSYLPEILILIVAVVAVVLAAVWARRRYR